jgi:hypothetical protein
MSKFAGIRRAKSPEPDPITGDSSTQKSENSDTQQSELSDTRLKQKGRPRGKRSDPSFEQVTAYIPKDLYRRVKMRILETGSDQDFSELLADLLREWLGD